MRVRLKTESIRVHGTSTLIDILQTSEREQSHPETAVKLKMNEVYHRVLRRRKSNFQFSQLYQTSSKMSL